MMADHCSSRRHNGNGFNSFFETQPYALFNCPHKTAPRGPAPWKRFIDWNAKPVTRGVALEIWSRVWSRRPRRGGNKRKRFRKVDDEPEMYGCYIFKLMIQKIKVEGLHERMDVVKGKVPLSARYGNEFFATHGEAFASRWQLDWFKMTKEQQRDELKRFMKEKFSIDATGEVMVPLPVQHWRPAAIDWGDGFYMTDLEMEFFANAIMLEYYKYMGTV